MSVANNAVQETLKTPLCSAVTGTGGQTAVTVDGYNGAEMVEIIAVGTVSAQAVTFQLEGSYDGTNFYQIGMQRVDAQASPVRAVTSGSIVAGAGTVRQVWQVLDALPFLRINPTANTLGTGLSANLYAVPV